METQEYSGSMFASTATCSTEQRPTPLPTLSPPAGCNHNSTSLFIRQGMKLLTSNFSCCVCLVAAFSQRQAGAQARRTQPAPLRSFLPQAAAVEKWQRLAMSIMDTTHSPARGTEYLTTYIQRGIRAEEGMNTPLSRLLLEAS